MKIGIAGTGRMGAAMAQRLMSVGHDVTVWNRTAAKRRSRSRRRGAKVAATPRELAKASDRRDHHPHRRRGDRRDYGGDDGLLSGDVKGKLFIEMSTVRPETMRSSRRRVKAKGAAFVDCPVGGSTGPARDGKLIGFVGGEAADVARATADARPDVPPRRARRARRQPARA